FSAANTGSSASRECSSCDGRRSLGVHVHDEMDVGRKESHLTSRISAVGAVCVRLDEFSNREALVDDIDWSITKKRERRLGNDFRIQRLDRTCGTPERPPRV